MTTAKLSSALQSAPPVPVRLHCPVCRHAGIFTGFKDCQDIVWGENRRPLGSRSTTPKRFVENGHAGLRRCPNSECNALVFIIFDKENDRRIAYPPEVIDFDATNLPPTILASLEEAVTCHSAGCYKAASLMVRRVLEELCQDKGAKGKDLKSRISALSTVAVIPADLLDAADELRLLGNDAAHVEAKEYDNIGEKEAALAIDLAKELLKAVYQYTSLVARLKALKKKPEEDEIS